MKILKKMIGSLAVLALCAGCAAEPQSSVTAVNPLKHYENVLDLAQSVEIDFLLPTDLPEGYSLTDCYTVSDTIVSLIYSDGENEALYRTAALTEELKESGISGDYTSYPVEVIEQIEDYEVSFRSQAETSVCLAEWTGDGMLFSLNGFTREQAEKCIHSLKAVSES